MAIVFLSYSRADQMTARRLVEDLRKMNINVWSDMDIRIGKNWANEIGRSLDEATAILVLISPNSLDSEWVRTEWSAALSKSRRVIPILIDGANFEDLPGELAAIHGVDLDSDYEAGINTIVADLKSLEESQEPPAVASIDKDEIIRDVTAKILERLGVENPGTSSILDSVDEDLIFVITSFLPDMEPTFEAIQAAATEMGLRAERVKDVIGDYRITDKILVMIRKARLIVADLTHERPNVYFELGYARGLGKTVVTIIREGSEAHFDVRDWTYLPYIDSRPLERNLLERFKIELSRNAPSD